MLRIDPAKLAFPCGVAPGFDPSHLAAANIGISVVSAMQPNFVNLLTGQPGAVTGALVSFLHGNIGPTTGATGGTNKYAQFAATRTGASSLTQITFGAIGISNASAPYAGFIALGTGGLVQMAFNGASGLAVYFNSNCSSFTLIPATGVPYFAAASVNVNGVASTINFLLKNLKTGVVQQSTNTFTLSAQTPGVYQIAGESGGDASNNQVAAAMAAYNFLSPAQLLQWSDDPWALWYPR